MSQGSPLDNFHSCEERKDTHDNEQCHHSVQPLEEPRNTYGHETEERRESYDRDESKAPLHVRTQANAATSTLKCILRSGE